MNIQALGHVVLRVTDRERAERFYGDFLGLPQCARTDREGMKLTFFSLGDHHDFAILEVSGAGQPASETAAGLHHVAFKIGTTLAELREAKRKLEDAGIRVYPVDHDVTKSLYFRDPDGNGIELYVDVSDAWREEPQRIAKAAAFEL